jgi:polyphosphate kinase 2 (PPK2 family)
VHHLPSHGEIVLFDRSWYNRAGVERVLGFCSPDELHTFLLGCPSFERLLVAEGIQLVKYWFSVSQDEQEKRFQERASNPLKTWKLSPIDIESRKYWDAYSHAKDDMMQATDIPEAPWYVVEADEKHKARLNCIQHLLSLVPYKPVRKEAVKLPTIKPNKTKGKKASSQAKKTLDRPPKIAQRLVPDYFATR